MTEMINIFKPSETADLLKAQKLLREKYGYDAPSYPTLRRWAAAGKLIPAVRVNEEKGPRVLYSLAALERVCLVHGRAKKLDLDSSRPAGSNPPQSSSDVPGPLLEPQTLAEINSRLELLFDSVATLLARASEQDALLKSCLTAVNGLASIRNTLMLKYDSNASLQRDLIDQLRERIKAGDRTAAFENIALKLGIQISHLSDKVSQVQSAITR